MSSSLPGLTRQSIHFERLLRRVMDARGKPAHDASWVDRRGISGNDGWDAPRCSTSARHDGDTAFSEGGFNGRVTILADIARDLFQLTTSVDPDFVQTRKSRPCQVSFLQRPFARTCSHCSPLRT